LALVLIVGGALLLSALGVVDLPFLGSRPPPPAPT
jgi:hypothetical protein